jgi:hypothetical protein
MRRLTPWSLGHALSVLGLATGGCSLDLDRLRARDAAPPMDAEADATGPDAPPPSDAPSSDTMEDAGTDASVAPRDGTLAVLARQRVGDGHDLAVGTDARGAFFVVLAQEGGTSIAQGITRGDCDARFEGEARSLDVTGDVLFLTDMNGDALLDVSVASATLWFLRNASPSEVAFDGEGATQAHPGGPPLRLSAADFTGAREELVLVTGSGAYRWPGTTEDRPAALGAPSPDTLDGLALDVDRSGSSDLIRLRAVSTAREVQLELGDGTGRLDAPSPAIPAGPIDRLLRGRDATTLYGIGPATLQVIEMGTPGAARPIPYQFRAATVAELDADGLEEIVGLDTAERVLVVLRTLGGPVSAEVIEDIAGPARAIGAVDLDGDDRDELVVLTEEIGEDEILVLGRLAAACPRP